MSSKLKVQSTGLSAHLKTLPLSQAVTVGEMLALIEVVNFNAHNSTKKINEIESELKEQEIINDGLLNLFSCLNKSIETLTNVIDGLTEEVVPTFDYGSGEKEHF
jgi:hypothetical protein